MIIARAMADFYQEGVPPENLKIYMLTEALSLRAISKDFRVVKRLGRTIHTAEVIHAVLDVLRGANPELHGLVAGEFKDLEEV
jgi:hypothetical protein